MYYYPIVTALYFIFASYKAYKYNIKHPSQDEFTNIMDNLITTEIIYTAYSLVRPIVPYETYSYLSFVGFYLAQDLYFYSVHKFIFHRWLYNLHKMHHSIFSPFHTWYCHFMEHIILNIGSFAFADMICPLPDILFPVIVMQQVYTSVNGHTPSSPHSIHHDKYNTHYGNIWIFDWLFG